MNENVRILFHSSLKSYLPILPQLFQLDSNLLNTTKLSRCKRSFVQSVKNSENRRSVRHCDGVSITDSAVKATPDPATHNVRSKPTSLQRDKTAEKNECLFHVLVQVSLHRKPCCICSFQFTGTLKINTLFISACIYTSNICDEQFSLCVETEQTGKRQVLLSAHLNCLLYISDPGAGLLTTPTLQLHPFPKICRGRRIFSLFR